MKILQICSGDLWAGAEVQFFYLSRQLAKAGYSIEAILFNEGVLADRLRAEHISVTILDENALRALALLKQFKRALDRIKPDVVHTHGHKESIFFALLKPLLSQCRAVQTVHGAQEIYHRWWRFDKHLIAVFDSLAMKNGFDKIIAVSHQLGVKLSGKYGAANVEVIENSIDIEYVKALAESDTGAPALNADFKIGIVGRLVSLKRHDLLLRALKHIVDLGQSGTSLIGAKWELYILGEGPERETIEHQVKQLGFDGRVQLMGELEDIYPVMNQLDLLVMSSDHEGLPMTLLEAMCLELPVVAASVGGIVRLLDDGRCGWLVAAQDEQAYADAIISAVTEETTTQALVNSAFRRLTTHYEISKKLPEYELLYRADA